MATICEEIGQYLKGFGTPFIDVQYHAEAVLAVLSTQNGRSQAVKIAPYVCDTIAHSLVRLESRVCVINDYRTVALLMQANARDEIGGFALNTGISPNVVDVIYDMVADELDFPVFAVICQRLASLADEYERGLAGSDEF